MTSALTGKLEQLKSGALGIFPPPIYSGRHLKMVPKESGVSESETKEMVSKMRSFDKDENGVLGEQEFRSLISSTRKTEENAMAATFRSYDRNGDGKVSGTQFHSH